MSSQFEDDDLDAFFQAAANNDAEALNSAANNVASSSTSTVKRKSSPKNTKAEPKHPTSLEDALFGDVEMITADDDGPKFVAVEPHNNTPDPFTLIPHNIPSALPWWAWVSVGIVLLSIFFMVMLMPRLELSNLTARLGASQASSQPAMRQLVMRGDEQTVNRLYDMASEQTNTIDERLRAIDVLSLIEDPAAARALLRLELASGTDARVRNHAIAARKQREASSERQPRDR